MTTTSIGDSFADDLLGTNSYDFERPPKKDFLPWHRPRKQFVREKQWAEQLLKLVTDSPPETGVIKYLGLPGDDLLDLRHFHDKICAPNGLKLKFLGFNKGMKPGEEHKTELEISLDEVNRLPYVDNTSKLVDYDFTNIALPRSSAWNDSRKMGPFDIINIDLCDGFAKQPLSGFKQTHYNTLSTLMTLQSRRIQPWLLMLTTRTDSEGVDSNVFQRLKSLYDKNLEECTIFGHASNEYFSVNTLESLEGYCKNELGFSNIFIISLCKWILGIALDQNPPSKMALKNAFGYKVFAKSTCPNLVSIAIEITPTFSTSVDRLGLVTNTPETIDECTLATRILKRVNKQLDVDKILEEDTEMMSAMITSTSALLNQARYDITNFENWVRTGDISQA